MQRFLKWLGTRLFPRDVPESPLRQTGVRVRPPAARPQPPETAPSKMVRFNAGVKGTIADGGPGKNVLVRKMVREDTGTHDTLRIVDESLLETEEGGIDPYNTGRFDRSKSWQFRARK